MKPSIPMIALALCAAVAAAGPARAGPAASPPSMADFLAATPATDWMPLDPEDTVYLDLPGGRVVMRLAPAFAPAHVANIRALLRAHVFDGQSVTRVQDGYVAQWGGGGPSTPRGDRPGDGFVRVLPAEYFRPAAGLSFTRLPDRDAYAPQTGFVDGFPVARDPARRQLWPVHCYAMVGVGRELPPDSGDGSELYTVIGHAPRHLDRNLALVGRIVQGIEKLSALPRGSAALGFYDKDKGEQPVPILGARLASELPPEQRLPLEMLRTDSASFRRLIELRRNRHEDFFVEPTGHIDVCNMPLPVRVHARLDTP